MHARIVCMSAIDCITSVVVPTRSWFINTHPLVLSVLLTNEFPPVISRCRKLVVPACLPGVVWSGSGDATCFGLTRTLRRVVSEWWRVCRNDETMSVTPAVAGIYMPEAECSDVAPRKLLHTEDD